MHIFVTFSLEHHLVLPLADGALHPEHQLLGGLRLLPQDGLGLTSKALLLAIVPVMFIIEGYLQKQIFSKWKTHLLLPWACLDSADFLYWVTLNEGNEEEHMGEWKEGSSNHTAASLVLPYHPLILKRKTYKPTTLDGYFQCIQLLLFMSLSLCLGSHLFPQASSIEEELIHTLNLPCLLHLAQ